MKSTVEELVAFRSIVDAGSITQAAEQLGQTVSGISRALRRLESKLGTTLLRRTTRRLVLTAEGEKFLISARDILTALDHAEEQLSQRREQPAGRVRVNAAAPYMLHAIVPWVAEFRQRYPLIELELDTDDVVVDLLEGDTDVAIRIGPLADSSLHARPMGTHARRVLASPAYLARHGKPRAVADLVNHTLLGFAQPENLNHWPLRHALGDRFAIRPTIRASSGETLRQLALAGEGIVCLADFMTARDREDGTLVPVMARSTTEARQPVHAVYYGAKGLSARVTCFLDFLQEKSPPR